MTGRPGEPTPPLVRRATLALAAAALAVAIPASAPLVPQALARPLPAASPSPAETSTPQPSDAAEGRIVFEERCATCHGTGGQGTSQAPVIAGLGPAFYDFMMSTGRMPLDQIGVQAKRRPPVLSPAEIRAVSDYLESISPDGIPIPRVNRSAGDLSVGEAAFQSNCAPCHGITGHGGAVGTQVAPSLLDATDVQVAEAVRIGPGTMPVFDEGTIDQHELDSLVRYVAYLHAPDDRGGAALGGVGPLVEGFVALVGALGLIVVVTRTIGTRS